tara:strand:- start:332 stop:658 length:327 start_codon:yes stop_codon:yes gene_type:complete
MPANKKEKTEKYIVVKLHTLGHKVGDVISLAEAKAKSLVGKVRLQSEGVENITTSGASQKLKDENKSLLAQIEAFDEKVEKFTEHEAGLQEQIQNLTDEVKALKLAAK